MPPIDVDGADLDLLGRRLRLSWAPRYAAATALLTRWFPLACPSGRADLTLRLRDGFAPSLSGCTAAFFHGTVQASRGVDRWVFIDSDGATAEIDKEAAELTACREDRKDPLSFVTHLLLMSLAVALRPRGVFHLHAGLASHPKLGATLVVGESGSGKSTTVAALANDGWTIHGDDTVWLRRRGRHVVAQGTTRPMHLGSDVLAELHVDRDGSRLRADPHERAQGKCALELSMPATHVTRPRWIITPAPEAAPGGLPISTAERMAALLGSSGLLLIDSGIDGGATRDRQLALLRLLAEQCGGRQLSFPLAWLRRPGAVERAAFAGAP